MSTFKKMIQEHQAAGLAAVEAKRQEELQKKDARHKFATEFEGMANTVIRPAFERFAADLRDEGFQAQVDGQPDEHGNPAIAVRFTCDTTSILNASRHECTLRFAGDGSISKVQRLMQVGQEDPGSGMSYTLLSITTALVNQQLAAALKRGLEQFGRA